MFRQSWKIWAVFIIGFIVWVNLISSEQRRGYQAFIKQTGNLKQLTFEEWISLKSQIVIIAEKD